MIYGYARVSTATQSRDGNSLEEQVAALTAYGCQEIIQEAFTGKTMERPAFQSLLGKLTESDMLVVTKLDRPHSDSRCSDCAGPVSAWCEGAHPQHGLGGEYLDRESYIDCDARFCRIRAWNDRRTHSISKTGLAAEP